MFKLKKEWKKEIKNKALEKKFKEICGVFYEERGSKNIYLHNCENLSKNEKEEFVIGIKELNYINENLGEIIAIFHSHPEGKDGFSDVDLIISERLKLTSVLYLLETDSFLIYTPKGLKISFEKRPFVPFLFDSAILLKDYFSRIYNLNFSELNNSIKDSKAERFIQLGDYLKENGFIEISKRDIKKSDVGLFEIRPNRNPIPFVIFVGKDKYLHQTLEYSEYTYLKETKKKDLYKLFRHKTL